MIAQDYFSQEFAPAISAYTPSVAISGDLPQQCRFRAPTFGGPMDPAD